MNNTSVESYLLEGCGRCDHFRTPNCKVLLWTPILEGLRSLVLGSGLVETMKWGAPCYTLDGKNVAMLFSFRESCGLSFFKGALLAGVDPMLETAGPNSRQARLVRFRSHDEFLERSDRLASLIQMAIEAERRGDQVPEPAEPDPIPVELADRLTTDPVLRDAFEALTPGRRRSHQLHVGSGKQSETRLRRVEQCLPDILAGKGFRER